MSDIKEMQDTSNVSDYPSKQLPTMLNVLTILTFIGCGLGAISTFMLPLGCKFIDTIEETGKMKEEELDQLKLICANTTTIMLIAFVGIILCFVGAMLMRKLNKMGFILYVIGELLPLLSSVIILGSGYFHDWKNLVGLVLALVFPILYFTQHKHLTK